MIGKTSVEGSKGVLSASAFHAATTTAKAATRRTIVLVTLATSADTKTESHTGAVGSILKSRNWKIRTQALGRCAGEDGYLLFESESVKVTKQDEASFVELFKRERSSKNGRPKQKARRLLLPTSSAETATIATEKGSPSPEKDGTTRTAEGAVDHTTPSAEERRPSGQELPRAARMSVPPTHRRLPVDRRPLADVDLCLRIGRESSPTHRQDSPPVQRRKGKEPAEDPPSAQGPSGQGPPAERAPGFAPSAPGPSALLPSADEAPGIAPTFRPDASLAQDRSVEQVRSVERDLTEERIVCPQDEIRARDSQLHLAQVHSA
ncbi:hypothetical protein AXG93_1663s1020 [Marchantia polymorpha subsp. ruderalis]|uniref:Uncharacterized protein n=1 Tax=Marchantia polymorpha subsp. ruderalis TaxID=1480154 RepID=A0A176W2Z1_MARPO|nr:hypothetical protein AXG93_1663s1020 [Marchantia polymorpha subsp. ruderalis]